MSDIVQLGEDELPGDYPAPAKGVAGRRSIMAPMARDILAADKNAGEDQA